jgi:hypothetical protein
MEWENLMKGLTIEATYYVHKKSSANR